MNLEELRTGATVRGVLPNEAVTVVNVGWHGSDALTLMYRSSSGRVAEEILYRHDEARLEILEQGRPWSFDGDGSDIVAVLRRTLYLQTPQTRYPVGIVACHK